MEYPIVVRNGLISSLASLIVPKKEINGETRKTIWKATFKGHNPEVTYKSNTTIAMYKIKKVHTKIFNLNILLEDVDKISKRNHGYVTYSLDYFYLASIVIQLKANLAAATSLSQAPRHGSAESGAFIPRDPGRNPAVVCPTAVHISSNYVITSDCR